MSVPGAAPPRKSSVFVALALGFVAVVFAVGLSVAIYLAVRPRGERVGELSLRQQDAVLTAHAAQGDTLVFRSDVTVVMPTLTLVSDDELERRVDKQLRQSLLTVRASHAAGGEHTATCPLYNGRATSTSIISTAFTRSGMLNECVIAIDQPGPWQVRASVAWSSELEVRTATLETRLEAPKR